MTEFQRRLEANIRESLRFAVGEVQEDAVAHMVAGVNAVLDHPSAPAPEHHVAPDAAARLERILRLGRSMKWTPHGAPALDDENTAVALGELFQIFFQDAVDRALATTEDEDNG